MTRGLAALVAGLLFGGGLCLSGMTQPQKVLGFLDLAGAWDPALLFVMGGAVGVHLVLFRVITRRAAPLFDDRFHVPAAGAIDRSLLIGAALFGVGWGLAGYCPGPAVVSAASGAVAPLAFVAAMVVGMACARLVRVSK